MLLELNTWKSLSACSNLHSMVYCYQSQNASKSATGKANSCQALKLSDGCSIFLDVMENPVTAVFGEQLDVGRCPQSVSLRQVFLNLVIGSKAVGFIVIKDADGFG